MKLIVNKKDGCCESLNIEYTPAEALIINHAMRRYVCDDEVNETDRAIMERMLDVKTIFVDVAESEEAINKQAALEAVSRIGLCKCNTNEIKAVDECLRSVKDLPPVNPQPNTGHWISFGVQGEVDGQIVQTFTCSECGAISIFRMASGNIVNGDLCPNCGAKMVESHESEGKE